MIANVRLVLTGGLVVLAGCHHAPRSGWVVVTAIGFLILLAALYHDIMRLVARPIIVRVKPPPVALPPARGGLGRQRPSEPGEYWPFDGPS